MVEDAGHLVDTTETNQWICANHGGGDKELLGADLWRLNNQRSAQNPNSQVATGASSERHSSPGYHAFYADCSLTGSQMPETTTTPCHVTLVRENRCPAGAPSALRHCYDIPVI